VNHPGVPCGGGCPRRTTAKGGICRRCTFTQKQAVTPRRGYIGNTPRALIVACKPVKPVRTKRTRHDAPKDAS
jgi:hypothetical protein